MCQLMIKNTILLINKKLGCVIMWHVVYVLCFLNISLFVYKFVFFILAQMLFPANKCLLILLTIKLYIMG